jgi:hypothetical protein
MKSDLKEYVCTNDLLLKKSSSRHETKLEMMSDNEAGNEVYECFNFELETWEPDHLHWVAPSNIILYSNGNLSASAAHLANMLRLGGIFDTGGLYHALFDLSLKESADSPPLITLSYAIASLPYKKSVDNVVRNWSLPGLPRYIEKANHASLARRWVGGEVPPPPTIPFPPIEFP